MSERDILHDIKKLEVALKAVLSSKSNTEPQKCILANELCVQIISLKSKLFNNHIFKQLLEGKQSKN